ncbi:MAG: CBS domain-containing protein [Thermoanaerobaculia bacterium]
MKVKDCMTPTPVTCAPATSLRLVAQLMADLDCAAIPIVDSGRLVGIITDRDIACRAVTTVDDAPARPAADFMTAHVIAIAPEESFEDAAVLMLDNHLHHLPVVNAEGEIVGIVAQSDLGRRMSNREFGMLARGVSIKENRAAYRRAAVAKTH